MASDVNYISPSSIMPQLGQVDIPGLNGYMLGQQQRDYNDIMGLQKLLGGMGAQREALSLDEKMKDVPMKDAERAWKTLGFQIDTDQMPAKKGFELNKAYRTEQLEQTGFPTSIEAAGITGQTKVDDARAGQLEARIQHIANLAGMVDGPLGMAQVMEQAEAYGIKPGSAFHKQLSSQQTPEAMKMYLTGLERHLNTTKAQGIRTAEAKAAADAAEWKKREEIARIGAASRERVGAGNNAATIEAARVRQQAAAAMKQKTTESLTQQLARLNREGGTPAQINQVMSQLRAIAGAKDDRTVAFIHARNEVTAYNEKNPKNPLTPEQEALVYRKFTDMVAPPMETVEGGNATQPPVQNSPVAPTGNYSNENNLRGIAGSLPPSMTPQELAGLEKAYNETPPGPIKDRLKALYLEMLNQVENTQQMSGPLPGLQPKTVAPPTTTSGIPGLSPGDFARHKAGKK